MSYPLFNQLGMTSNGSIVGVNESHTRKQQYGNYHVEPLFTGCSVGLGGTINQFGTPTGSTVNNLGMIFDSNGNHIGGLPKL